MKRTIACAGVSLLAVLTASCLSTYQLSQGAARMRGQMDERSASAVLDKYVKPAPGRDGACLASPPTGPGTKLDYRQPVKVSGSVIAFAGFYAVAVDSHVTGSVMAGTGKVTTTYEQRRGAFSIDAKSLKQIVVITKGNEGLIRASCPGVKMGYLVGLEPEKSTLPNLGAFMINVGEDADLDAVMAALNYLSPNASLRMR